MTAIIIDIKNGVIACESRVSAHGLIITDTEKKCVEIEGELYFMSGSTDSAIFLVELIAENKTTVKTDLDALVAYTKKGKVMCCTLSDGKLEKWEVLHNRGIGTGGHWALAALDFGVSAKEAIEYAITRDVNCGGDVMVYKVPGWIGDNSPSSP